MTFPQLDSPPVGARLRQAMAEVLDASADLLLGAACPGCARPGLGLCQQCEANLADYQQLYRRTAEGLPVLIAHHYQPLAGRLVVAHKERGAWRLAKPLGTVVAARIADDFESGLFDARTSDAVVTAVPSDPAAQRERGYDHAFELAQVVAKQLSMPAVRLLERTRAAGDQVGRSAAQRELAQAGSMRARAGKIALRCRGRPIIIVDDVMTTGATLAEAARALRVAGQLPLLAACLATST